MVQWLKLPLPLQRHGFNPSQRSKIPAGPMAKNKTLDKMWLPAPECFYSASKVTGNLRKEVHSPSLGGSRLHSRGFSLFSFVGRQQEVPQLPNSCACLKLSQSLGFSAHLGETKGSAFLAVGSQTQATGPSVACQPEVGGRDLGFWLHPPRSAFYRHSCCCC